MGKNSSNNNSSIQTDSMLNEHHSSSNYNNDSNPSINFLSAFFSILTSPFRSHTRSNSPYGSISHQSNTRTFKYNKKQRNGETKNHETNSIYHQLNVHTVNDENNNQTKDGKDQNSIIIDLFPLKSSQSKEALIGDDDDEKNTIKIVFTTEHFVWLFVLTILYFTWFILIAGISIIPLIIYLIIMCLYLLSDRTRRFALAIIIYLTYLFLYDALHLVPNYTVSQVHIRDVYSLEKKLFGVFHNGNLLTLNEYFKIHHIPLLDIVTGLCYLNW